MYSILKGEELDEQAEEIPFAEYVTAESKAPKEVVYNAKIPPEFFDCILSMNAIVLFTMYGVKCFPILMRLSSA